MGNLHMCNQEDLLFNVAKVIVVEKLDEVLVEEMIGTDWLLTTFSETLA